MKFYLAARQDATLFAPRGRNHPGFFVAGMVVAAALATTNTALAWAVPLVMGILAALAVKAYLLWQRERLPALLQQFCAEHDEALARIGGHYPPY